MNKWYAEIDETGYCFHITQDELPLSNTILLVYENVLGKKYEDGKWVKVKQEVTSEPSQLDRIEEIVSKSAEELRQEGAEALTLELIEGGIL